MDASDGKSEKKIIFINKYFYPDHSATSQLLSDLAFYLAERDKSVHIITGNRQYDKKKDTLKAKETIRGVQVHRVPVRNLSVLGIFGRAIESLLFFIFIALKLFSVTRPGDVLVAKTDPPMLSVMVCLVAKLRKAKIINWVQDVFPEIAEKLGLFKHSFGLYPTLRKMRDWSLNCAMNNIVLGTQMKLTLVNFGVPGHKIQVIPNWVDEQAVYPVSPHENPLRKAWGLEGKFVVLYSGNMGRAHAFDAVLEAGRLLAKNSNIVFLFVGGGIQREQVQQAAAQDKLNNFLFKDYQSKQKLAQSFGVGDVHLVILSESLEGLIVPSKVYGALAAGRAVIYIGSEQGDVAKEIKSADCGFTFSNTNGSGLAECLAELSKKPEKVTRLGTKARQLYDESMGSRKSLVDWDKLLADSLAECV